MGKKWSRHIGGQNVEDKYQIAIVVEDICWIIMRRIDIPLWKMVDLVATCIVLYKMCTIGNDSLDIK